MRIPDKRYRNYTVFVFGSTFSALALSYLDLDYFSRIRRKILIIQVKVLGKKIGVLDLVDETLYILSAHGISVSLLAMGEDQIIQRGLRYEQVAAIIFSWFI